MLMSDVKMINLKINGIEVQAPEGEPVIEAAKRIGVDVPFFCYHPRLSMSEGGANCRMCLVEVAMPRKNPDGSVVMAKMPKPQTACSLPVSEGMEVQTETESTIKDRKGILEFILINHPLDCPICDRGGECPLQNNTIHYGPPTTRYIEEKRHLPKAFALSEYVVFDRERCIHCARCTRFTTDISGDAQLDFLFRGADMKVGTFEDTTFKSRFSGNVIELCPVGALLSKEYRFKARPWDLMTQRSICTQCSNGCNIKLDYRVGSLQRVNARVNEGINEEWTCDKGKFGMGYVSGDQRIKQPLIRKGNSFVPASWQEANDLIIAELKNAGHSVGGIGGSKSSNEDLFLFKKFFRETLGVNNIDHRMGPYFGNSPIFGMTDSIVSLETKKSILVLGSNLVDEQPILFLRVRKAWKKRGAKVIEALPSNVNYEDLPNHVGEFASQRISYNPGSEKALANGIALALLEIVDLKSSLSAETVALVEKAVAGQTLASASATSGVSEQELRNVAAAIVSGSFSILVGELVTANADLENVIHALNNLATVASGNLNVPVTKVNQQGALDLGILPNANSDKPGLNTEEMLKAAASGSLKALWLVDGDLVNDFYVRTTAEKALENVGFLIVNAYSMTATASMANVILPMQTVVEGDGTYTNVDHRVQRFFKAFEVSPDIHSAWVIFQQISAQMGHFMPYFSAKDINNELCKTVPTYSGTSFAEIGDQGIRVASSLPEKVEA